MSIHDIVKPGGARGLGLDRSGAVPLMYLDRLFKLMAEKQASDLFISCGAPINIKINGVVSPISTQPMDVETVRRVAYALMTKDQAREFENEMEMNLSYLDRSVGNFRINIFRQRGTISLCIRYVRSNWSRFSKSSSAWCNSACSRQPRGGFCSELLNPRASFCSKRVRT